MLTVGRRSISPAPESRAVVSVVKPSIVCSDRERRVFSLVAGGRGQRTVRGSRHSKKVNVLTLRGLSWRTLVRGHMHQVNPARFERNEHARFVAATPMAMYTMLSAERTSACRARWVTDGPWVVWKTHEDECQSAADAGDDVKDQP